MKKIILFISLFHFLFSFSQTHRFIYQLDINMNDNIEKINMVLDIDKNKVKFYDYQFVENDSIGKTTGQEWMTNTRSDQLLLRNINSFENVTFHDNMFDYFSIKSTDKLDWRILDETKKIGQYTVQKAVTNFGGRDWIAWFSSEVPFQEGPYKFRGLPGLIFELSDKENFFHYTLIKSVNLPETYSTQNFLETHYGNKPIVISLKQYHKIKVDYYIDPVAEYSRTIKNGGNVNLNGEKIITQSQLDQKRGFLQKTIKKNYYPVELNKAIPYPN